MGTPAAAQEKIQIKFASLHAATESFMQTTARMFENVTARTGGRVTFETYYGSSLLKAADLYPGLASGAVGMASSVPSGFNPREFPVSGVILPCTTENALASTLAYKEWYETTPEVQAEFKRNNAHMLLGWPVAENVLWTQKRVETMQDLRGLRLRMLLGPGEALSMLGATAVAVPYTETIDLLQRGGVDGISSSFLEQGVRDGLGDVVNYVSSGGRFGIYTVIQTSVRLDLWNKLPDDIKQVFRDEAEKATAQYMKDTDAAVANAAALLHKAKKTKVVVMDPAEEARWCEATKGKLLANYVERTARVKADGKALHDKFRDLVAKHSKDHPYKTALDRYLATAKQ